MTGTPFERVASLQVGTVDFVSPNEIKVVLDIEAPDSVALNAGLPRPFPRVNGYLLISVDEGFLVGQIEWMTVERSPFPKRRGMQDFGLVDLPYPVRRLCLNPLGTLRSPEPGSYRFRRGADALPSIGSAVLLPTDVQLRSIVESGDHRPVQIGTSPLAGNARVFVDPNRLFGRHLAVLGNTGSGKSCSVAGLIRWSLEEAQRAREKAELSGQPNARFIILDPNGEYSRAFGDPWDPTISARVFKVNSAPGEPPLKVPLWFWNSGEWCAFTQASAKTQRPLLKRALREIRAGKIGLQTGSGEEKRLALRRYLSSRLVTLRRILSTDSFQTDATKFGRLISSYNGDIEDKAREFHDARLDEICHTISSALESRDATFRDKNNKAVEHYKPFSEDQVTNIVRAFEESLDTLGGIVHPEGPSEDTPLPFDGAELADHLEMLASEENVSQFVDFLVSRIRMFLADPTMREIAGTAGDMGLAAWLTNYVGAHKATNGCVSIIDLSLVPSEVVHVVTAVIARMVFEALQRYVKHYKKALPTVLVMEEAHTFVKRYKDELENHDAAAICCQVFERIAREGRKFGLGLVLSSQRPAELSPTVLSQCNSFLLHRISNDRDQELVHRLVPDNLRGLLRELPSLPSQSAILLGWAAELPVLVKMRDLPKSQQPRSDDPDFWEVWVGKDEHQETVDREVDWQMICDGWQGIADATTNSDSDDS